MIHHCKPKEVGPPCPARNNGGSPAWSYGHLDNSSNEGPVHSCSWCLSFFWVRIEGNGFFWSNDINDRQALKDLLVVHDVLGT